MELKIRRASERGLTDKGWLKSYHSFSFGDYYDEKHRNFYTLKTINDDKVEPGMGFGTHPHKDMEIISYIVEGSMEHRDSMGNGFVNHSGDIQKMSAGTGITHSEFNHSQEKELHFLQIWVLPEKRGIEPEYQQISLKPEDKLNHLKLVVTPEDIEDTIKIYQQLKIYTSLLEKGAEFEQIIPEVAKTWIQVVKGNIEVNGKLLFTGDGCYSEGCNIFRFIGVETSEFLFFEIP